MLIKVHKGGLRGLLDRVGFWGWGCVRNEEIPYHTNGAF